MADYPVYKSVFDVIPLPSLVLNADPSNYRIIDVNEAYLKATRTKKEDLVGRNLFEAHPDISDNQHSIPLTLIRQSLDKVMDTGVPHELDAHRFDKQTDSRYWKPVYTPVLNEEGQVDFIIGTITEVTEQVQKNAERKLKLTQEKLQNIVEYSTNMFYSHTTDGVLNYVSPQCRQFFGYEPEESLRNWTEFITDHPVNKIGIERTKRAIDTGERQPSYELQLQKRSGEIIWVEINEAPVVKNGKTVEIVGSLTDITTAKLFKQELLSVNKKLKNAQHIAKIAYWEYNLETDEIYWSDEIYQICGMDKENFVPSVKGHEYSPPGVNSIPHLFSELSDSI